MKTSDSCKIQVLMNDIVSVERIASKIYVIRQAKVMLDKDLAELYSVETRVLNQAVNRHKKRFPDDFMFQLSKDEYESLISQFVTSKKRGEAVSGKCLMYLLSKELPCYPVF